jgi:hypothetical protein
MHISENDLRVRVCLSMQRALLGSITPNIRAISVAWDQLKSFSIRVYYDTHPTEDDLEQMEIVASEVLADIPFERMLPIEAIYDIRPQQELENLMVMVYSRKEGF